MDQYFITYFDDQFAMEPKPSEPLSWDDLKEVFSDFAVGDFDKTKEPHFNGCKFKTGTDRRQDNVEFLSVLVLDFDDGMLVEEAKRWFKKYRHIGYTSYNHLFDKKGDGVIVEKFRVLLPLAEPVDVKTWKTIRHNVETFAPTVDMASVRLHQPFAIPLKRKASPGEMWVNEGECLDVSGWQKQLTFDTQYSAADPTFKNERSLKPDDILKTKKGNIRVGDISRHISGIYCPFHDDHSPGAFANKSQKGNIFLHCQKAGCGTFFMEIEQDSYLEKLLSSTAPIKIEEVKANIKPKDEQIDKPYDQAKRRKLLEKQCLNATNRTMLLYAFEGFGKSYFAYMKAKLKKQKVVFACSSNEQAEQQAEDFEKRGLTVQFIPGREWILKKLYDVQAVYNEQTHPWDTDTVNKEKTLKQIMLKVGVNTMKAEEIWSSCSSPAPDFFDNDIIVTTIARTQVWGRIQRDNAFFDGKIVFKGERSIVPPNTFIFYDDPDTKYFLEIHQWSEKYAKAKINDKPIETTERNGRKYFVRPKHFRLGWGLFFCNLVFTTTERMTKHLIETIYPGVFVPELMPKNKMAAGDISLISTPLVREKQDGYLTVAAYRVNIEMQKLAGSVVDSGDKVVEYIANGSGRSNNLVSSKGKNNLSTVDTIVKISYPHPLEVLLYIDALGWDNSDGNFVGQVMVTDVMHQAIGRNSGYRWSDKGEDRKSCVVLVDPQLCKAVTELTRYNIRTVDPDKMVGLKQEWNTFLECVCWFIRNDSRYIQLGIGKEHQAFWHDIRGVVSETKTVFMRMAKARILKTLKSRHIKISDQSLKNQYEKAIGYLA